jgi:predicted acylesterase/phospholipase RssA
VAIDLKTGQEVWLREGTLIDVVRASITLPGIFTPCARNGQWLVDGGLMEFHRAAEAIDEGKREMDENLPALFALLDREVRRTGSVKDLVGIHQPPGIN